MRRARPDDEGASLDLLLDTITNTLGGILFLAILLVLLPKASRAIGGNYKHSATNLEELRDRLADVEAMVESRRSDEAIRNAVFDAVADPNLASELREIAELREKLVNLNTESAELNDALESLAANSDMLRDKEEAVARESERTGEDLATLAEEYASELRRRRSDLPVPSEREARTVGAKITIRYGRLYFDRGRSPADDESANLDDFIEVGVDGEHRVVTPKPWAGTPIVIGEQLTAEVKRAVNAWPTHEYHLDMAVWDDSFDAIRHLRTHLSTRGQSYRLIPVTEGDEVSEGYTGNVRVQ